MKAFLILENGTVFEGTSIGSTKEIISEIVFNTSMAGYVEILTDPSYAGQAVAMTYPLIGNTGVCSEDMESSKVWPDGFIVRELSRIPSNFRSEDTIQHFLEASDISGISGIDTRALTKILRENGTMNGMITTNENFDLDDCLLRIKAYRGTGLVEKVTCKETYIAAGEGKNVALLDLGVKKSLVSALHEKGCAVTVYPAFTKAETILAENPDGIVISNGPGNPEECTGIIAELKKIYESDVPVFAMGLGHQLMALATGASVVKLPYGHHGSNYPVKDVETGRVYISSQKHEYAVDAESVDPEVAAAALVNVNDGSCEGLRYVGKKIITIEYQPDAYPGSQDTSYDQFMNLMEVNN